MAKYDNLHLYRRMGHKYRDGWAYLDGEEHVGTLFVLQQSAHSLDDGYTDARTAEYTVLFSQNDYYRPPAVVCEAIRDTFGGSNCQHEHDCCGCWSSYVHDLEYDGDNVYQFSVSSARNY